MGPAKPLQGFLGPYSQNTYIIRTQVLDTKRVGRCSCSYLATSTMQSDQAPASTGSCGVSVSRSPKGIEARAGCSALLRKVGYEHDKLLASRPFSTAQPVQRHLTPFTASSAWASPFPPACSECETMLPSGQAAVAWPSCRSLGDQCLPKSA